MFIANIFSKPILSTTVLTIPLLIFVLQCKSSSAMHPKLLPGWHEQKKDHPLKSLNQKEIQNIILLGSEIKFESLLDPLLIPRVPGTENWLQVKKFLIDHMEQLGWTVETDSFEDDTPNGRIPFENIIATLNPGAPRRLVIACHFDSKYEAEYDFIGAVDSSVPCAQMLHLAYAMKEQLDAHNNSPHDVTLQYIFFDGEEAFKNWSDDDSLYGSRHLAKKWEETPYPPGNMEGTNELHRIDVLMLLDLIGASKPKFYSFFEETSRLHTVLANAEKTLHRYQYLTGIEKPRMFSSHKYGSGIADDHIPFMQRQVNILHVISVPFPDVWHTAKDTKESLDFDTIENLNRIFRVFVVRYLHLGIPS